LKDCQKVIQEILRKSSAAMIGVDWVNSIA